MEAVAVEIQTQPQPEMSSKAQGMALRMVTRIKMRMKGALERARQRLSGEASDEELEKVTPEDLRLAEMKLHHVTERMEMEARARLQATSTTAWDQHDLAHQQLQEQHYSLRAEVARIRDLLRQASSKKHTKRRSSAAVIEFVDCQMSKGASAIASAVRAIRRRSSLLFSGAAAQAAQQQQQPSAEALQI